MKITNSYQRYCYPIYDRLDPEKLSASVDELFSRFGCDRAWFIDRMTPVATVNLTHLPGLSGPDRWLKHNGSHLRTKSEGVDEHDFTELLSELDGLYLKDVMLSIFGRHEQTFGVPFQGRCQIIGSSAGFSYPMHTDPHTKHRYHIPIQTDRHFYFMFENKLVEDTSLVRMPADGRIWYLNPLDVVHTIVHVGTQPRIHVMLTT